MNRKTEVKAQPDPEYLNTKLFLGEYSYNKEYEQGVLGLLQINNNLISKVNMILQVQDFYGEADRTIYKACIDMNEKNIPVDALTLHDYLKKSGELELVGGSSYITYLPLIACIEENLDYYLKEIKCDSIRRAMGQKCNQIINLLQCGEDNEKLNGIIDQLSNLSPIKRNNGVISISDHQSQRLTWLLENAIPDRFPTIIYGEGGMGKSYIALFISILVCLGGQQFLGLKFSEHPRNVLYVDYELDENEITRRAKKIIYGLRLLTIPNNLYYWSPERNLDKSIDTLRQNIKSNDISFIVIDSLGASAVDGENVADIVNLFSVLRKLEVAILILDHQSKMQAKEKYHNKTPYGSVYKYNLSRSVFQLSNLGRDQDRISICLKHTKSNFGKIIDDIVFDIRFEEDKVIFTESRAKTPLIRNSEFIREAIDDLTAFGEKVTQKALITHLKGIIGKDKIISTLNKGEGKYWEKSKGSGREFLYSNQILKCGDIYNQNFRISDKEELNLTNGKADSKA